MAARETSTAAPSGPGDPPAMVELAARQNEYMAMRRKVALGMLFVAPALIALPPRKLDLYTFGLGLAWVYCLNEVAQHHVGDVLHMVGGGTKKPMAADAAAIQMDHGWKGDKADVFRQYREREDDGKGIREIIMESVWDVWQQKGKRHLTSEQEDEEDLPLKERVAKYEREIREKKEREAVDALTRK